MQDQASLPDEVVPSVQFDPTTKFQRCVCNVTSDSQARNVDRGALMDRGANGGIIGDDARPFRKYQKCVDVTGIAQHQMVGPCMCDAAALSVSNRGPVIIILQQYAHSGKGRTMHSSGQSEKCGKHTQRVPGHFVVVF